MQVLTGEKGRGNRSLSKRAKEGRLFIKNKIVMPK
jgi:hypothetical protein